MKANHFITREELDAIRFYMGDPEIVNRGDFKGGPKAYNTINALLHSGIQNELDKIREGRVLEIEGAEHAISYINLCILIYSAMKKYQQKHLDEIENFTTYRVDRESMMQEIRGKKAIEGFYSTCKYGFLETYAHSKEHVALIEIRREESVPYLDFEELFRAYYAKPEEAELLIPFGTEIQKLKEIDLTEEEKKRYTDIKGNPPCAKYQLTLTGRKLKTESASSVKVSLEEIVSEENVEHVKKCLKTLMEAQKLDEEDLKFYVDWKEKLQTYILGQIS